MCQDFIFFVYKIFFFGLFLKFGYVFYYKEDFNKFKGKEIFIDFVF